MGIKTAAVTAAAAVALVTAGTGASAAQAADGCRTRWGSLAEQGGTHTHSYVTGVRAGKHACFDRLVVDLAGPPAGTYYDVGYVPAVRHDGSGTPVPLRGAADLQVIVRSPSYDTESGHDTYRPTNPRELASTRGARTFRQVAWAGSFEGQTTIGLGVRARLPFRVMVLPGPGRGSRVVVDVAHTW